MTRSTESEPKNISPQQLRYYQEHGLDFLKYKNLPPLIYQSIMDLLAYGKTISDSLTAEGNGSGLPKREDFDRKLEQLQADHDINEVLLLSHPQLSGNVLQVIRSMIGPKVGGAPFAVRHIPQRH